MDAVSIPTTTFSVLICTYNRDDMLAIALNALINATAEKPDEVVVVNGGDEKADAVVKSFEGKQGIDVRLIKTVNKNLATSRNIGLEQCKGQIVAMTDDDAEVYPDWVTQIKRVYNERPNTGAVGGAVLGADSADSLLSRLSDLVTFPSPSTPQQVRNLPGVNVSYKREVLQKVGAQDTTLFRGEDVDFNWRVKRLGYEVYYDPAIKVTHYHRPTIRKLWRQTYMYGRGYFLVRQKWQDIYALYPRRIDSVKSILKLINFCLSTIYRPILNAMKMRGWQDRLAAIPILMINDIAWKSGVVYQGFLEFRKRR